jgi:23S rRNA-/tRNA-specific pseudouridylate synthase
MTGRTHQIRIHLSGAGHPILGDTQYQGPRTLGTLTIPRVALHALRLELPGGEVFESPWPEDFASWVEALRGGGVV